MAKLGPARGPKRAGPGPKIQALGPYGPKRANDFLFKIPLCIVRWPLDSNKGIMYSCNLYS